MTRAAVAPQAFFLEAALGQRFCLFHAPPGGHDARAGLLYIHPFAEEMNRSRRLVAEQSRAFVRAGFAVLQMDLYGCGDSAGDFEDATWALWRDDVMLAHDWLRARITGPLWLWGLRSGCLLAAQLAGQAAAANLLFWQPVVSGQQHLKQFLRLGPTADMLRGGAGAGVAELLQQLALGNLVEVAGYRVSPKLARGLALATLDDLGAGAHVRCLELSHAPDAAISPALAAQLLRWQAGGCQAVASVIEGPACWQVAASPTCPALQAASLNAVAHTATGHST
ncbi:MAG: hydrolase 2, exosortase A system-associated [Rhodoferax sp.]|jgi:exosortase A-associated hydrolase 2|nr:hydrolase 2, exosortase A system-associated [Rhodoferax sp.]